MRSTVTRATGIALSLPQTFSSLVRVWLNTRVSPGTLTVKVTGTGRVGALLDPGTLLGKVGATGRATGALEAGRRADFIVLDPDHSAIAGQAPDAWLSGVVFCEHGAAPDADVRKSQGGIEPWWKAIAGGCHLTRDIPKIITDAGWRIQRRKVVLAAS